MLIKKNTCWLYIILFKWRFLLLLFHYGDHLHYPFDNCCDHRSRTVYTSPLNCTRKRRILSVSSESAAPDRLLFPCMLKTNIFFYLTFSNKNISAMIYRRMGERRSYLRLARKKVLSRLGAEEHPISGRCVRTSHFGLASKNIPFRLRVNTQSTRYGTFLPEIGRSYAPTRDRTFSRAKSR